MKAIKARRVCGGFALVTFLSLLTGCLHGQGASTEMISNVNAGAAARREEVGSKPAPQSGSLKAFNKVYKEEGWEIKGIDGATAKPVPTYLSETISPKINLVELTPQGEGATQIDTYFYHEAKGLIVLPSPYKVNKIFKFSVNDRPFCYEVRAEIINPDETNKAETLTGKRATFHYYDDDNDGKFETFEWGQSSPEPRVPQWVLKK